MPKSVNNTPEVGRYVVVNPTAKAIDKISTVLFVVAVIVLVWPSIELMISSGNILASIISGLFIGGIIAFNALLLKAVGIIVQKSCDSAALTKEIAETLNQNKEVT